MTLNFLPFSFLFYSLFICVFPHFSVSTFFIFTRFPVSSSPPFIFFPPDLYISPSFNLYFLPLYLFSPFFLYIFNFTFSLFLSLLLTFPFPFLPLALHHLVSRSFPSPSITSSFPHLRISRSCSPSFPLSSAFLFLSPFHIPLICIPSSISPSSSQPLCSPLPVPSLSPPTVTE